MKFNNYVIGSSKEEITKRFSLEYNNAMSIIRSVDLIGKEKLIQRTKNLL